MTEHFPTPAFVAAESQHLTEDALLHRARNAVAIEAWVVGECASQWTERYARGRTDADFAELIGMTRGQVQQRRAVFDRFGNHGTRLNLTWSHFNVASAWEDADECLSWAAETEATVAEMRAWRRAIRGEDLSGTNLSSDSTVTVESDESPFEYETTQQPTFKAATPPAGVAAGTRESAVPSHSPAISTVAKNSTPKAGSPVSGSRAPGDPEQISKAVDRMLTQYSPECQQKSVQYLLSRLIRRLNSIDQLLPDVNTKRDTMTDMVRDVARWSVAQVRRCQWTDKDRREASEISEILTNAAVAVAEIASGQQNQLALFEAGQTGGPRLSLSQVLKVWNAAFETQSIATAKRSAALRSRVREPYFVENWQIAIAKARDNPFCCGHNSTGWIASIDWLLKPDTVVKIMEGNYSDAEYDSSPAAEDNERRNANAIATVLGAGRLS